MRTLKEANGMKPMTKPRFMSRTSAQRKEYARRLVRAVKLTPRIKIGTATAKSGVSVGDVARILRHKGVGLDLRRKSKRRFRKTVYGKD